jgi:hypothetical protein
MPQLWTETFVTQYFWLVAILLGFYYIASLKIIPQIANTLKVRRELGSIDNQGLSAKASSNIVEKTNNSAYALLSTILVNPELPKTEEIKLGKESRKDILANVKLDWVKKYTN